MKKKAVIIYLSMDLSVIDIVVAVIIIACAIFGAIKGFISQIVSIVSLILGIWCACKLSELLARYVEEWFSLGESAVYIVSFIIILVVVIILCHFIGKGIEKIVRLTMMNWLNRMLGFLFAAAKVVIIMSVVVYILDYIDNAWNLIPEGLSGKSLFYSAFLKISHTFFPYLQSIIG